MKIASGLLPLSSLNIFATLINIVSFFLIGRFGGEQILAAIFFSYSTLQLLVNVATFRTDALLARFGFDEEKSLNRSVLVASQLLDLAGAFIYCGLVIVLYHFIEDWFANKFAIDTYITLFLMSWLVYICKQTVYGLAVSANRYMLISTQGAIAAFLRPTSLMVFIYLGFTVYTSAALMYLVSELLSFCLLLFGVRDIIRQAKRRGLPDRFWRSSWHLYASSTLSINDNNFNESLLPVIAEPKLAACLLLLRKAYSPIGMLVQPLATLMLGKLSQLSNRKVEEVITAVSKTNGIILLLGCLYIGGIVIFQQWLGRLAGFDQWLVSFELALLFGVSLLLRYLLWWVQPVFAIFNIPMLYLFNALMIIFLVTVYLLAAGHFDALYLDVKDYILVSLVFYFGINILILQRLKVSPPLLLDAASTGQGPQL